MFDLRPKRLSLSELLGIFDRSLQMRFDFALFLSGHDSNSKSLSTTSSAWFSSSQLRRQVLVDLDVVKSAEVILYSL